MRRRGFLKTIGAAILVSTIEVYAPAIERVTRLVTVRTSTLLMDCPENHPEARPMFGQWYRPVTVEHREDGSILARV